MFRWTAGLLLVAVVLPGCSIPGTSDCGPSKGAANVWIMDAPKDEHYSRQLPEGLEWRVPVTDACPDEPADAAAAFELRDGPVPAGCQPIGPLTGKVYHGLFEPFIIDFPKQHDPEYDGPWWNGTADGFDLKDATAEGLVDYQVTAVMHYPRSLDPDNVTHDNGSILAQIKRVQIHTEYHSYTE